MKLRIEDVVYHGIENGQQVEDDVYGHNSAMATWAGSFIDAFETKDKTIKLIRSKVFDGEKQAHYVVRNFWRYINLRDEVVLSEWEVDLKSKLQYKKEAYKFIRRFIWDKKSELYEVFSDSIQVYESKYVKEEDRIPEELDIPW